MDEGVSEESSSFHSVQEIFNECLPYFLSIGMPAVEFWEGDPSLAVAYRKADELKKERMNFEAWLTGLYTYKALIYASPLFHDFVKGNVQPMEYEEPIPITQRAIKEKEERDKRSEIEKAQAEMKAYIESFMKKQRKG